MSPQPPKDGEHRAPERAADLDSLVQWLESLAESPERFSELDDETLRRVRVAAGKLSHPDRLERRRFSSARRRAEVARRRAHDDAALEATSNRSMKRALGFRVAPPELDVSEEHRRLLEHQARERTTEGATGRLLEPRACYVCKSEYSELHFHYDSMCGECADFNWRKRTQTADLSGRVALVTGARVKIGFEIVLMLLRAGARVLATTRFAVDAAERFAREADFDQWSDRLEIRRRSTCATRRRSRTSVADLLQRESRFDLLIHNACQTVRRPPDYYAEMVAAENARVSSPKCATWWATPAERSAGRSFTRAPGDVAALSPLDLLGKAPQAPVPGRHARRRGAALDLRDQNSWRLELHEVSTIELLEVQLVNAIAPFVLNARLKP